MLLSQGQGVGEFCRRIGITEQTFYRWCREYGGLTLDKLILKEAVEGNW